MLRGESGPKSAKLKALLFFYSDPDFSGIVRIIRFVRWIDLDLYSSSVFVTVTARKELTDNLSIGLDESFRHPALEREYRIGERWKLNCFQIRKIIEQVNANAVAA